jgi:hypothetical protein
VQEELRPEGRQLLPEMCSVLPFRIVPDRAGPTFQTLNTPYHMRANKARLHALLCMQHPCSRVRCKTKSWKPTRASQAQLRGHTAALRVTGGAAGDSEDYSPEATVARFDPPLPLLRAPFPSSRAPAFRDAATWQAAWEAAEASLVTQCQVIYGA